MWLILSFLTLLLILFWSIALYRFYQRKSLPKGLQQLAACLIRVFGIFVLSGVIFSTIGFVFLPQKGASYGALLSLGVSIPMSIILALLWAIAAYEKAGPLSVSDLPQKMNNTNNQDILLDDELTL